MAAPREEPSPVLQQDPTGSPSPTDSPTDQPSPNPTDNSPSPPVDQSPTVQPTLDSPTPGPPGNPGGPQIGISVSAGNAVLTDRYWSGVTTTSLKLTAMNVGSATTSVVFTISMPAGVHGSCPQGCQVSLAPGETKSIKATLQVAPDAWKSAPLTGGLTFTATAPGAASRTGQATWGVVFPPGPPTPGLQLHVSNVQLEPQPASVSSLRVQVINTGKVPAPGALTVVAPNGVSLGTLPAGCVRSKSTTAVCNAGTVDVGKPWEVRVPLVVPDRVRADAPLVGLVRALLSPSGQTPLQTQASYQIFAAAGQTGVTVGTSAQHSPPAGGAGLDLHDRAARFPLTRPAVVWPIIGGSLLLLAVATVGILLTLRRRREEALVAGELAAAAPAEPVAEAPAPTDKTAVISAGPVDRTPTPKGPISWEWRTGEEPVQPAAEGPAGEETPEEQGSDVGPVTAL